MLFSAAQLRKENSSSYTSCPQCSMALYIPTHFHHLCPACLPSFSFEVCGAARKDDLSSEVRHLKMLSTRTWLVFGLDLSRKKLWTVIHYLTGFPSCSLPFLPLHQLKIQSWKGDHPYIECSCYACKSSLALCSFTLSSQPFLLSETQTGL